MALARRSGQFTAGIVLLVGGIAALAILLALTLPSSGPLHRYSPWRSASQGSFSSLGERIFLTGTDESGNTIPRSELGMMMGPTVGCADCHGLDAKGRTITVMMGRYESLDIRWSTLTSPQAEDGETWVPYDDASFARAMRQGVEPNGESVEFPMPRWQLTDAEISALIAYLRTL
jgi:cytochrome c oxidase subunit II